MRLLICFLLCSLFVEKFQAKNYYVDSRLGDDNNVGTNCNSPWRTIEKINNTTFNPGDSILFRRGCYWKTNKSLSPKGSGTASSPIVISSYDDGFLPLFIGQGFIGTGVVLLKNQSHWIISDLEMTNWSEVEGDRRGVEVIGDNGGLLTGIYLKNLRIHHIKGILADHMAAKRTAGIAFFVTDDKETPTRFDDIRIENCQLYSIVNEGIVFNNEKFKGCYPGDETWNERMFTNVLIRDNVIHDISKNAMIVRMTEGGLVEHNVCFQTGWYEWGGNTMFSRNVRGTVFQYNESFQNRSPDRDGSMYDPDLSSPNTIWRYSYSHDNAHGLVVFCTSAPDKGIVVHDNISEDDHGFLVYFNYPFKHVSVSRNLFYVGPTVSPYFLRINRKKKKEQYVCTDNLVYNNSLSMKYEYMNASDTCCESQGNISRNLFLGNILIGKYENEWTDLHTFQKFHRGFLGYNILDSLLGNKIQSFEPGKNIVEKVIGTVNGIPIFASDWYREFERNRWKYVELNDSNSYEKICQAILESIVYVKVQIEEMAERKMPEAKAALNIEWLRRMENDFRRTTSRESVMWFGPQQYATFAFWDVFWADAQEQLRKLMKQDVLSMTDIELERHFALKRQKGWLKFGYDYSLNAIQTSLLDEKYDEYMKEKVKNAVVNMNMSFEELISKSIK